MAVVFAADTMRRVLPSLIEATKHGLLSDESSERRDGVSSANLALSDPKQFCEAAFQKLSAHKVAARSAARSALTLILLSEPALEPTGDLITTLLGSWRSDLVSTLKAMPQFSDVRLEGGTVVATTATGYEHCTTEIVKEVVRVEHEHSDWLVGLLTTRAVGCRHDLDEVAAGLWEFSKQRADTSIRVEGRGDDSLFQTRLKQLNLKDELQFLGELQESVARDLKRLAQEPLTPEVLSLVREQVLTPLRFPKLAVSLSRVPIHPECVDPAPPSAERMSSAEIIQGVRARASSFMQACALDASVFYERATSASKRCIAVDDVPPLGASRLLEITRIMKVLADHIKPIVADDVVQERILSKLTDSLRARGLADPTVFSSPMVLSSYIGPDDTIGKVPLLLLLGIAPQSGEAPSENKEDDDTDEAQSSAAAQESQDDSTSEVSTGFPLSLPNAQPLSFQIALLPGVEKKDLPSEAEKLIKWFGLFEDTLRESSAYEDGEPSSLGDPASDGLVEDAAWRYHGLSHSDCDELCRDFLDIVATSYPELWELLPESARVAPTICDISTYSPLKQSLDVATCVHTMAEKIGRFSEAQREKVRTWLVAFEDAESQDERIPTVEFLLTMEHWETVAECYLHPSENSDEISISELDEDFGVEDFNPIEVNDDMIGPQFFGAYKHLLMNSLTQQGRVTLRELLQTGHIFLAEVSTECIKCLNEVPLHTLHREIGVRAKQERLSGRGAGGAVWYESPNQKDYSTPLALSSSYGSVWKEVLGKHRNVRSS
jgi:hypothetical protein